MLPTYYREPVFLCAVQHNNYYLSNPVSLDFAAQQTAVPIGLAEFRIAATQYPIVFIGQDNPMPVIVTGLVQGGNLFIDRNGNWDNQFYCPGYLKQYPFYLLPQENSDNGVMVADRASQYFSADSKAKNALKLFKETGEASQTLLQITALCTGVYHERQRTDVFASDLKNAGVLVERNVRYPDRQSEQTLSGLLMIDESILQELPPATLMRWFKNGWTEAISLHLASQHNWKKLLLRYQATHRNKAGGR